MQIREKWPEVLAKKERLVLSLEHMPSCMVAFSGGLDSAFLLLMAKKYVPGRVAAATVSDPTIPMRDLESAKKICSEHNVEHKILYEEELEPGVVTNSCDRCYHCKKSILTRLKKIAEKEGLTFVLDGENASDAFDNRPGRRAARELDIISPLAEAGLEKEDIRLLAKEAGLDIYDRPSSACLASRIPHGTAVEAPTLRRIDHTEELIRSHGFRMVRARMEAGGVRIELGSDEMSGESFERLKLLENEILSLGWRWVALDLRGYVPAGNRSQGLGD
ncbi:MAG: ATP-dependent sacrificial sulfur transferase LarE [Candidatus Thermoplasmatota archaeon]|nr:ATP-dependent sacrificial sulfur transferase LarE [Candidatus Thermoplasmatota archaeon]